MQNIAKAMRGYLAEEWKHKVMAAIDHKIEELPDCCSFTCILTLLLFKNRQGLHTKVKQGIYAAAVVSLRFALVKSSWYGIR